MELKITICDDEKTQSDYLACLVERWAEKKGGRALISVFDSAEAFLFHYPEDLNTDILMLDIQMRDISGLELAKNKLSEQRKRRDR